jgi:hypothetical protein
MLSLPLHIMATTPPARLDFLALKGGVGLFISWQSVVKSQKQTTLEAKSAAVGLSQWCGGLWFALTFGF